MVAPPSLQSNASPEMASIHEDDEPQPAGQTAEITTVTDGYMVSLSPEDRAAELERLRIDLQRWEALDRVDDEVEEMDRIEQEPPMTMPFRVRSHGNSPVRSRAASPLGFRDRSGSPAPSMGSTAATTSKRKGMYAGLASRTDGIPAAIARHTGPYAPDDSDSPNEDSPETRKQREDVKKTLRASLPFYDGGASVSLLDEFVERHRMYLEISKSPSKELARAHIGHHLGKGAAQWFNRARKEGQLDGCSADDIFAALATEFLTENQKDDAKAKLEKLTFEGSTVRYHHAYRRHAEEARLASGSDPIQKSELLKMFLAGYERGGEKGKRILEALLTGRAFQPDLGVEYLMQVADRLATAHGLVDTKKRNVDDESSSRRKRGRRTPDVEASQAQTQPKKQWKKPADKDGASRKPSGKGFKCFNCDKEGHYAAECRQPKRKRDVNVNNAEAQKKDDRPAAGFR